MRNMNTNLVGHSQKFNFKNFVQLIAKIKPRFWQLGLGLFLGLIATGMQLIVPKVAQRLINQLQSGINMQLVVWTIVLFVLSALVSSGSGAVLGFFGENVVNNLRQFLWRKILVLPVNYFDETKSGEISSRVVNDTSQVKDLLANSVPNMVTSILQLVGALVLMLIMDWKMTLIMFIGVPLVILCVMPIANQARKISHARQDTLADFNGEVSETLGEIRLVKASTAESVEQNAGNQKIQKLYNIGLKEAIYDSISGPVMQMVMMGMMIGILVYGASRVAQGTMSFGTLISFFMYLVQMVGPFATMGQFFTSMAKASGSTARIQELLTVDEEVQNEGQPTRCAGEIFKGESPEFCL